MGSGKGKTRRVQKTADRTVHKASFSLDVWHKFLKENKLNRLSLTEYYLGPPSTRRPSGILDDCDHVIKEFFKDLVLIGAITLPSTLRVEDLKFKMVPGKNDYFTVTNQATRVTVETWFRSRFVGTIQCRMPQWTVKYAAEDLVNGINKSM